MILVYRSTSLFNKSYALLHTRCIYKIRNTVVLITTAILINSAKLLSSVEKIAYPGGKKEKLMVILLHSTSQLSNPIYHNYKYRLIRVTANP